MFSIRMFFVVNTISLLLARSPLQSANSECPRGTIIDPVQLVMHSNDRPRAIHCNGHKRIDEQKNKLTASIGLPITTTTPKFELQVERHNATTIRIVISPNKFIGVNLIHCHWEHKESCGETTDLIIGEAPGDVHLLGPCRAYDRRYVQCVFNASIIARAVRNGFPQVFRFAEVNHERRAYLGQPTLEETTDDGKLVFHFDPLDRESIPARTNMTAQFTLKHFGSTNYSFAIEPEHITNVDFHVEKISTRTLTIRIDHNATDVFVVRRCAGDIYDLTDRQTQRAVARIAETAALTIDIDRLRPSTKYKICLHCYYNQTDHSFTQDVCVTATTKLGSLIIWIVAGSVVTILVLLVIGIRRYLVRPRQSSTQLPPTSTRQDDESLPIEDDYPKYDGFEPIELFPGEDGDETERLYLPTGHDLVTQVNNSIEISPDTRDLTRPRHS